MSGGLECYHFTFLQGIRVRSGTNYLSKVVACHPDIQLVAPGKSTDELPILHTLPAWEEAFARVRRGYVEAGGSRKALDFQAFAAYLGDAWLRYLVDTFHLRPGHVFVKDPHVEHLDRFFALFPHAKLVILVRDGRDNVASSVKAGLTVRRSMSFGKRVRHWANHLVGRDFVGHTLAWASCARRIQSFDASARGSAWAEQYRIVRYEDVFEDPAAACARLFEFIGVPVDEAVLAGVANAEVVGSSFYGASGQEDATRPNWKPTPRTAAFRPVGRWKKWGWLKKRAFHTLAGKELAAFGYAEERA